MDVTAVIDQIAAELARAGTPERAIQERAYLKLDLVFLGVTVPGIRRVSRAFVDDHPDMDRSALLGLVTALWARDVHELRMFAIDLLDLYADRLTAADLDLVERLLRTSGTWAYVDSLAVHVAGALVVRSPALGATLDRWSIDPGFWVRRASMLALLLPLRAGGGDLPRFLRYADAMLEEREFFIRKAIGWVLRDIGRQRPDVVQDWLQPRIPRVSGVTIREAVRHLPAADRDALLAAYRAR